MWGMGSEGIVAGHGRASARGGWGRMAQKIGTIRRGEDVGEGVGEERKGRKEGERGEKERMSE